MKDCSGRRLGVVGTLVSEWLDGDGSMRLGGEVTYLLFPGRFGGNGCRKLGGAYAFTVPRLV